MSLLRRHRIIVVEDTDVDEAAVSQPWLKIIVCWSCVSIIPAFGVDTASDLILPKVSARIPALKPSGDLLTWLIQSTTESSFTKPASYPFPAWSLQAERMAEKNAEELYLILECGFNADLFYNSISSHAWHSAPYQIFGCSPIWVLLHISTATPWSHCCAIVMHQSPASVDWGWATWGMKMNIVVFPL